MIKLVVKRILLICGVLASSPLIILTRLEEVINRKKTDRIRNWYKEILSICPTTIGEYLRLGYYWAVCTNISVDASFLFGSMVARPVIKIGAGTVVGTSSIIGYAEIGENVLIGARVSILSGKYQHGRPQDRAENLDSKQEFTVIKIGDNSWIGEGALILANVGNNCTVGAGSVVLRDVPDNTTVLGNPARKVNI